MGTTSEKLTYLNETKSKIKDNINLTGAGLTNQTPFRQYATGLKTALLNILNNGIDTLYNNFPQTTGTGTNITLNNTLEAPIKSELLGNTSQNGTPTPDTPVEVINATGGQNVEVLGKNLLNVTDVASTTTNGITYYRENQTYYLSGTNTKTDSVWVLPNNIITNLPQFEVGKNYTLKITGTLPSNVYVQVNAKNQSNSNYSLWPQISDTNAHTITIGSEYVSTAQVFIGIRQTATNVTGNFKIQIEEGATATEYEAYKEQSYEINLGNIELCKIDNYQDRIYKDNGKWYIEKQIGKVVLDGSITGSIRSDIQNQNTICFRTDAGITNVLGNSKPISNYFTAINDTSDVEHIRYIGNSGYRFQLFLSKAKATTANEVISWLSTHNTTVYYILATPTITEITDSTLLNDLNNLEDAKSYNGTTNITITAETPADIKITALKNE